ncbi:TPA: hypothetical protein U2T46_000887 [Burkholderia cenocepacia]|nr:hypothetical protein [Burkholderia cenocepacia]
MTTDNSRADALTAPTISRDAFYDIVRAAMKKYRGDNPSRYLNDDQVDANDGEFVSALADQHAKLITGRPVEQHEAAPIWRCFHCDEVFTDQESAALHFGTSERQSPACSIDVTEYRAMERRMHAYNEEDTDLHRTIHRLQAQHQTELRREEEKGYARGLADGSAQPEPPAPTSGE